MNNKGYLIIGISLVIVVAVGFASGEFGWQLEARHHSPVDIEGVTAMVPNPSDNGVVYVGNNTTVKVGDASFRVYVVNGTVILEGVKIK